MIGRILVLTLLIACTASIKVFSDGGQLSSDCLPDDGAKPPNCGDYVHLTYIPHPYNCSRYWECEPENSYCLYECPLAAPNTTLYFNPKLNVCDWPANVNCTNSDECNCKPWQTCVAGVCVPNCKKDSHCGKGQYCDYIDGGKGECQEGCRHASDCGICALCIDHKCSKLECCRNSDCKAHQICLNNTCQNECAVDSDCGSGEICSDGACKPDTKGCTTDAECGPNQFCENGVCKPGCKANSDCKEPGKPICSSSHVCVAGCMKNTDCEGSNAVCDAQNTKCSYCDQSVHACRPGCSTDHNCDDFHCNAQHKCSVGLKSITLDTYTCIGCQGAQGIRDEDGPFMILVGNSGVSCNTRQLDNPRVVDFDNGKSANFVTEDILQSCYKADLGTSIVDGSIHWTSLIGTWKPKKIKLNWSNSQLDSECCCLNKSSLSSSSMVGKLVDCSPCHNHPGCK